MLGRTICVPMVKLSSSMDQTPKLLWHSIIQRGQKAGEALLAAELILKDKVCQGETLKLMAVYVWEDNV